MDFLISILIGTLFGAGIFCLLRRSVTRLIIGIMLLPTFPLYAFAVSNILFACLQLYWATLVTKQVIKTFFPGKTKES